MSEWTAHRGESRTLVHRELTVGDIELFILPRRQGKHLLLFFDFQMPRDLLSAQPARGCDTFFALI